MINRPHELQEFYKRHGKPLEVGMSVNVNHEEFNDKYIVEKIKLFRDQIILVQLKDNFGSQILSPKPDSAFDGPEGCSINFSPSLLTPIL